MYSPHNTDLMHGTGFTGLSILNVFIHKTLSNKNKQIIDFMKEYVDVIHTKLGCFKYQKVNVSTKLF